MRPARNAPGRAGLNGARQAHEQAYTAVDWLQRRVTELSDRLDRMHELPGSRTSCVGHVF